MKTRILMIIMFVVLFTSCGPSGPKVTIIEKWASHCGACKMQKPVIDAVERDYEGQVAVIRYDIDDPEQYKASSEYTAARIPAFYFKDKKGKVYFSKEGIMTRTEIDDLLRKKGVKIK